MYCETNFSIQLTLVKSEILFNNLTLYPINRNGTDCLRARKYVLLTHVVRNYFRSTVVIKDDRMTRKRKYYINCVLYIF